MNKKNSSSNLANTSKYNTRSNEKLSNSMKSSHNDKLTPSHCDSYLDSKFVFECDSDDSGTSLNFSDLSTNTPKDSIIPTDVCNSEISENLKIPANSQAKPARKSRKKEPRVWNSEDDQFLLNLGVVYKNDWKKIVKRMKVLRDIKKTPTFLMKRYREISQNENEERKHFKHNEDLKLAELMETLGTCWIEIAKHFPNRGPITIKNRYYSYIKRLNLLEKLQVEARNLRANPEAKIENENPEVMPSKIEILNPEDEFIDYSHDPSQIKGELNDSFISREDLAGKFLSENY